LSDEADYWQNKYLQMLDKRDTAIRERDAALPLARRTLIAEEYALKLEQERDEARALNLELEKQVDDAETRCTQHYQEKLSERARSAKLVEAARECLESESEINKERHRKAGLKPNERLIGGDWRKNSAFYKLDTALAEYSKDDDVQKLVDSGFHACQTGDCPHEKQSECDAELAEYSKGES
jgi:hypothetical protein